MKKKVRLSFIIIPIVFVIIWVAAVGIGQARKNAKKELFDAIENNDPHTVSEILARHPTLVNENEVAVGFFAIDRESNTPLIEACKYCEYEMVELLVENGANIDKSSNVIPCYPLIRALLHYDSSDDSEAKKDKYDIAWYLIENGANLSVEQQFYTLPYAIVGVKIDGDDIRAQEQSLLLMQYVIQQGVSLDPPNPSWNQQKVDNMYTKYGINCVLGLASRTNHVLVVEYLIDSGMFDMNGTVDGDGRTSLMVAVQGQAYDVVMTLLSCGADKQIRDNNGLTAYDYAKELNDERLIAMLGE